MDRADLIYPRDACRFELDTTQFWAKTGDSNVSLAQTMPRWYTTNPNSTTASLISGTIKLNGGITLLKGDTVKSITACSGPNAGATLTHQWFCIVDQATLTVLAVTNDDTSTAWAANSYKSLAMAGGSYINDRDRLIYVGICITATTVPSFFVLTDNSGSSEFNISPALLLNGPAGLTTPSVVGTVYSTSSNPNMMWMSING